MLKNVFRGRLRWCVAAAAGALMLVPGAAWAGTQTWTNPYYLAPASGVWDNYSDGYQAQINTTETWNYYTDNLPDCTGVWQTSIPGLAAEACAYNLGGHNTATCTTDGNCMGVGSPLPGHPWIWNGSTVYYDYFTGWWAWN